MRVLMALALSDQRSSPTVPARVRRSKGASPVPKRERSVHSDITAASVRGSPTPGGAATAAATSGGSSHTGGGGVGRKPVRAERFALKYAPPTVIFVYKVPSSGARRHLTLQVNVLTCLLHLRAQRSINGGVVLLSIPL